MKFADGQELQPVYLEQNGVSPIFNNLVRESMKTWGEGLCATIFVYNDKQTRLESAPFCNIANLQYYDLFALNFNS